MTASVLKQDPNTKRFKQTLIYWDTATHNANFRGHISGTNLRKFAYYVRVKINKRCFLCLDLLSARKFYRLGSEGVKTKPKQPQSEAVRRCQCTQVTVEQSRVYSEGWQELF